MFIGHFAVGFASKAARPEVPLGWLLTAPLFLDLLWPVFLATGLESVRIDPGNTAMTPLDLRDYPYSHSLAMAVVWSALFGGAYAALRRDWRGAALLAAGVMSHWVLDFVTHGPDLPLYPGSETYVGLGLWHSKAATLAVEIPMFAAAVWLYARGTAPRLPAGRWSLGSLIAFLAVVYAGNAFGPPPPSTSAIAIAGLAMWLFVPWAAWIERTRAATTPQIR